ncbi:MAG: autotransporter domain-containing protein [Pseudomonas sp.]
MLIPVTPSSWVFEANGHDYVIFGLPVFFEGAGLINNSPELIVISNSLGGTGAVIKNNALGTLALYGNNTYTGGTIINAGTLSVDVDSNLGAPSGPLTIGNGTLNTKTTFATNRSVTLTGTASFAQALGTGFTLNGTISGPGSLNLSGDGSDGGFVTLNADNTYTGATNLNSGVLFVNGSIATSSLLTSTSDTFIGGTGMLSTATVAGSISPGARRGTSGTLGVAGNLSLGSSSQYTIDFNPGSAPDLIHATGSAELNGATATTVLHDFIPVVNQRYTILTADAGVTDTFTYATRQLPLSDVSLVYDANNVYFLVSRNDVPIGGTPLPPIGGVPIPPVGGIPEHPIAITPPQTSTGGGVDELPPDHPILGAIVLLPTVGEIRDALDQLSGQLYPSHKTLLLEDSHFVRDAVYERLDGQRDAPVSTTLQPSSTLQLAPNLALWVQGVGASRDQEDLSDDTWGTFFGLDSHLTDTTTLGILGGYTRADVDAAHGSATGDNYSIGTYLGTVLGPWSLKAGTSYTFNEIDAKRHVSFGDFHDSLSEDYSASTSQVFAGAGYRINAGPVVLEPYVDFAWVRVSAEGFTEDGGPAALRVDSSAHETTFSTLGLRPSYSFVVSDMPIRLKGGLGWRHAYGDLEPSDDLSFAPTDSFGMPGVPLAEDTTVVSLGLEAALTPSTHLGLSYNGQFASDVDENGLTGLLRVMF